jgi:hypothetical protein
MEILCFVVSLGEYQAGHNTFKTPVVLLIVWQLHSTNDLLKGKQLTFLLIYPGIVFFFNQRICGSVEIVDLVYYLIKPQL